MAQLQTKPFERAEEVCLTVPQDRRVAEDPDAPAIRAVLAGSAERFGEIVKRHHRSLLRLVSGLVMDSHLAEDVAQEVWWNAYRRLESFEFRASFRTWLFKIAVNEAMSARNRLRRLVRDTFSSRTALEVTATESGAGDAEVADEVRRALKSLPPRERVAFLLHVEGIRYDDIAASLSCPPGTVATWIHRARERLGGQLGAQFGRASDSTDSDSSGTRKKIRIVKDRPGEPDGPRAKNPSRIPS